MFSLFKCTKKEKAKEVKPEVQEEKVSNEMVEESLYDGLLCLRAAGEEKTYKDVTGLYEFRGIVYFKPKDGSGKVLDESGNSFTDNLKKLYPDERFTSVNISTLKVRPVVIANVMLFADTENN